MIKKLKPLVMMQLKDKIDFSFMKSKKQLITKGAVEEILNICINKENILNYSQSEIETLSKRWRILELLAQGSTQREIAKDLQVSLCKVTRGAKILKDRESVLAKYFIRGN